MLKFVLLTATAAAVAGCSINPKDYETTPVVVQSAAGPVTCQLYTHDQVTWDRAVSRPGNMSVETADNLCRQEGYRVMRGESAAPAAVAAPAETDVVVVDAGL